MSLAACVRAASEVVGIAIDRGAARDRRSVRLEHVMARFGDDVFCLLFQSGDKDSATELAEGIRAKVEDNLLEVSGKSYQLTIRIGLCLVSENAPSKEEIISRAHLAADAIEDGNGVLLYELEMEEDIETPDEDVEPATPDFV